MRKMYQTSDLMIKMLSGNKKAVGGGVCAYMDATVLY